MTMQSLSLLPELRKLPVAEGADTLGPDETVARIRGMDRHHFAIEVSQATEEAMEALFDARNVPDVLNEAFGLASPRLAAQGAFLYARYEEVRGSASVTNFVSNLKGKVAELQTKEKLEEFNPGWTFELARNPTQPVWDISGIGPDGAESLIQVKARAVESAGGVVDRMQESPNVSFHISSEIYDAIAESHPELVARLTDIGSVVVLTEFVKEGLHKLAGNHGVDVPDSLGEALPFVGEVVLGIKLIWGMVKTERQLADVDLTDRSRVHGIRALALLSRFGINQVCMWAGAGAGAATGTVVLPGPGTAVGGLSGGLVGIGSGRMLNKSLQPRIEEVAMRLIGGDADDMFYLMNKAEIDGLGQSFTTTRVA